MKCTHAYRLSGMSFRLYSLNIEKGRGLLYRAKQNRRLRAGCKASA